MMMLFRFKYIGHNIEKDQYGSSTEPTVRQKPLYHLYS